MIFGRVINQTPSAFEFEVATTRADAQHFGLSGRIWFNKKDCKVIRWADGELDSLECSPNLLRTKAIACVTCD